MDSAFATPERVDIRLVPAALTCWAVTAVAIVWRVGAVVAAVCVAVGVCAVVVGVRARRRDERLRASVCTIVLGAAVVGAGFGWATAVRVDALDRHPVVALYGRSEVVTVAAAEQPRLLRDGRRVIFRAGLLRIGADETSGRVTVFAPVRDFAELSAGQPVSFRAVFERPTRRDLSVAVLTAAGTPTSGEASPVQRAAQSVRRSFAETARAELPPDQAAALPALVLGDTSTLAPEAVAEFRAAGLTHLTAVSGERDNRVRRGAAQRAIGRPTGGGDAGGAGAHRVRLRRAASASVLRAAVMGAIALLAV